MSKRLSDTYVRIKELLKFEFLMSYQFIPLASFIGLILLLSGLAVMFQTYSPLAFSWNINEPFSGFTDLQEYINHLENVRGYALRFSYDACLMALSFLIPLIVAFTLSKSIEDGTLKTFLSYPIGRMQYIMTKSFVLILLLFVVPISSSIFWIFFWYTPGSITYFLLSTLSYMLTSALITATMTLMATATKSVSRTALGGIISWGVISLQARTINEIVTLQMLQIVNPFKVVDIYIAGYIYDMTILDVGISFAVSLVIICVSFFISILLFKRMEVN